MAAGDTALTVCSDALLLLGARPISSFNEGTDEANLCDRLYPNVKKSTLQAYPWSFSFKKVQLARTINTPVNEYKYEYQLPSDRLGTIRRAFTSTSVGAGTFNAWTVQGDKLLTNEETIVVDYQFLPEESAMPAYFVQLLNYMMAWHLADPVTDQISKTQYWQQIAVGSPGENNRGGYFRTAMVIDGQGNVTQAFEDYSLINVRF
jgi:hypothetical protein